MSLIPTPRVVVTVHGIQTQGKWQKNITPYLAKYGLIPYHIDYGWFSVLKFLCPISRERQLNRIREELRNLVLQAGTKRISVIAHSFGTYLAMEALRRENGAFKYDRVVLTGSIVPRDFNWNDVFEKRWVMAVRNERATSDWVVGLADFVARRLRWIFWLQAGDSGRECFEQKAPGLLDDFVVGNHSETHNALKFKQWARFIAYPLLPEDILEKVRLELSAFRGEVAAMLGEAPDNVRVNMFAPIGGSLRIVPGTCVNMTHAPELDLKIELGHGATGAAFSSGNPCIVTKEGAYWSGSSLPVDELDKLNPSLKWVIALPVRSASRKVTICVINVDGFNIPEKLKNVISQDAQEVAIALLGGIISRMEPCLEVAFRGEYLPEVEV